MALNLATQVGIGYMSAVIRDEHEKRDPEVVIPQVGIFANLNRIFRVHRYLELLARRHVLQAAVQQVAVEVPGAGTEACAQATILNQRVKPLGSPLTAREGYGYHPASVLAIQIPTDMGTPIIHLQETCRFPIQATMPQTFQSMPWKHPEAVSSGKTAT
jgi:hypothetical protein